MGTKLKYNSGGEVQEIPLTTDKPQGKRLAIHHNDQNFYAPLVDAGDATASNLRTVYQGQMFAVRQMPAPEIENILIEPPRVSVMQGQSATAIVSASGNEAVTGLSYSIANNPTWITISDECILIQPSDNDLGEAVVEVIAKDTGSNASMSTAFVAEALLRPIISSLSVVPPAVTVNQGMSATAQIQAVANTAVTGLSYSLDGAPSWVSNDYNTIALNPTTADSGTSTVNVVAYDTNSSARAETQFVATAEMVPDIYGVIASPSNVTVNQGESAVITLSADYNTVVTGIEYSLENAPAWMTLGGNQITVAPTATDVGTTVTVIATARDTGSHAQASTQFVATAQELQPEISGITVQPSPAIKHSRVVGWQECTLNYPLTCTANSKVTSVRYSLAPSENNPAWLSISQKTLRAAPTTANSALGDTATVTIVAYDTKSTARATTEVCASVSLKPSLSSVTITPNTVLTYPGFTGTLSVVANSNTGVESVYYELDDAPPWVTLHDDIIYISPTTSDTGIADIYIRAFDTGSTVKTNKYWCAAYVSLAPEINSMTLPAAKVTTRPATYTITPKVTTTTKQTVDLSYQIKSDHDWMSIDSYSGKISLQVPDSVPFVNESVTGNYTVTATSPTKQSSVTASSSYIIDMRARQHFINLYYKLYSKYTFPGQQDTITSISSSYLSQGIPSIPISINTPLNARHYATIDTTLQARYPIQPGDLTLMGAHNKSTYNPLVTMTAEPDNKTVYIRYNISGVTTGNSYIDDTVDASLISPCNDTLTSAIAYPFKTTRLDKTYKIFTKVI